MKSLSRFGAAALFGAAAVVLALVVRLVVLGYPDLVPLDSDEAVTGLMAQHILSGSDFPVFFAGQNYMGSLEQYIQAGVLAVTPDNAFTLRIPEAVIAAATCADRVPGRRTRHRQRRGEARSPRACSPSAPGSTSSRAWSRMARTPWVPCSRSSASIWPCASTPRIAGRPGSPRPSGWWPGSRCGSSGSRPT